MPNSGRISQVDSSKINGYTERKGRHLGNMKKQNNQAFKRAAHDYFEQLRIEWRSATLFSILPGIGTILVFYVPPLIVGSLLQKFSNHQSLHGSELVPYIALFGSLWLLGEVLWRITIHLMINAQLRSIRRLYTYAMDAMLQKDLSFFHDNFAGSLTKKTIAYAKSFEPFVDTMIFSIVCQILPLIFISVVLWLYSPWLVVGLVGMLAFAILCVTPLILRRQKMVVAREAANNVASGHIADIYANIDAVRAFANEPHESALHAAYVDNVMRKSKKSWDYGNLRVDAAVSPIYTLTNVIGLILALTLGGSSGHNVAAIFVAFSYYASFTRIMWDFNRTYRQIESSLSEAAQFTELLHDEPKIFDNPDATNHVITKGDITLHNVDFSYNDDSTILFEKLNLHVKSGEKIGLVGHSGGGKTTITKLLLRFMDINGGEILIDGQNIAAMAQSTLRKAISYVPQDPAMFHRSIADNIRYGKLDASDEEVALAAKRAHATEFIDHLPQGLKTLVGERGIKLSGGQRQRIAIARAMIRNAPILLLDEATSALDSESEKYIQEALWELMKDRTAIVIAHRLSTIQKMDRIIVIDKGNIIEEGTHAELLTKHGMYAKLWAHQSGGFIDE